MIIIIKDSTWLFILKIAVTVYLILESDMMVFSFF